MAGFPDSRWGPDRSRLRTAALAFARSRAGTFTIRTLTPLDRRVMLRSTGRYTLLGPIGAPTVLLTTTGARSGQARRSPLLYARDGERLIVAGSNFGQDSHPAWTHNLLANPEATVAMAGQVIPVRARLLAGAEAEAGYRRMVELADVYAVYRSRTARQIRVFSLERAG